jgi:tetratricopeptide (TPR) repeat protein
MNQEALHSLDVERWKLEVERSGNVQRSKEQLAGTLAPPAASVNVRWGARFCAALVLLLAFTGSAAVLPPSDGAARAAWNDSLRLEQAGDTTSAIATLRGMPADYAVSLRRGWLKYLAGDFASSAADYRDAVMAAPQSIEARLGWLLPLLASGISEEAETVARSILNDSPNHPIAAARLGAALRLQGRLDEAEQVLRSGSDAYPTDVTLLTELALLMEARGRPSEARALWDDVITLDPENAAAKQHASGAAPFTNLGAIPGSMTGNWLEPGSGRAVHGGVSTYIGSIRYDNTSVKDYAWVGGVNGWLDLHGTHFFEAGLDALEVTYQQYPRLGQIDVTAAYANASVDGLRLRVGGHAVETDDPPTDGAWVGFAGMEWRTSPRTSVGLDGYVTRYPEFGPSLDVVQLNPRLRVDLARGADWTVRLELSGDWMHTDRLVAGLEQQNFFSGGGRLSLFWRRWSVTTAGWAGQQAFAVRNRGYTVFNIAEEHTAGAAIEIQRALGKHWIAAFRARRELFRETFTGVRAAESLCLGTIGFTF